ncbi:MAG: ISKra4 family transposase [Gammaproteobacteria bacterium]|nr:ISKra4 family transposase [Gammaproteobacteria bacterium]
MQFKLQVVVDDENGEVLTEDIIILEKSSDGGGLVGLSLAESKRLLKQLQEVMVSQQARQYTLSHRCCPACNSKRRIKGTYDIQYRTLFGIVPIPNVRLYHCDCEDVKSKTFGVLNDWLSDHNSPELQYIETKWASLMSYGMTVDLLKDVLPVNDSLDAETVRHHLHKTAMRQDEQLKDQPRFISGCQNQWAELPRPGKPMTVGIDGGYVRDSRNRKSNFEVIVAKSFSETEAPKRLGFVQTLDDEPERRLMKMLKNQGLQENQQIVFLSDGADNVRDLQQLMHPESDHILDWFHLTMRLTVLNQFAKGVCHTDPDPGAELLRMLESTKWYLWHGNTEQALEHLEDCWGLSDDPELRYDKRRKLAQHLSEMITYIDSNAYLIPNYGEKYRCGETITTAFVESTVNEVVAKRMVKKQQMQWTQIGAHCLLQTRTAVLNGELRDHFKAWYPELRVGANDVEYEVPVKLAA